MVRVKKPEGCILLRKQFVVMFDGNHQSLSVQLVDFGDKVASCGGTESSVLSGLDHRHFVLSGLKVGPLRFRQLGVQIGAG